MPKNRKTYQSELGRSGRRQLRGRNRRISIRSELRDVPDVQKIAHAVVALAMAQAEKDAQAVRDAAESGSAGDTPAPPEALG